MSPARDVPAAKAAKETKESKEPKGVTINVMGREFRVAAPEGEERQLMASVDLLNKKMKELRDGGKVVGNERIAIMAALNIAHDYLQLLVSRGGYSHGEKSEKSGDTVDAAFVRRKMESFESIIEKAVSEQEKLF
jgi:cell division protein ZapA